MRLMQWPEQLSKNLFYLGSYHSVVMIMFCWVWDLQCVQTLSICQKSFYCFTRVLELLYTISNPGGKMSLTWLRTALFLSPIHAFNFTVVFFINRFSCTKYVSRLFKTALENIFKYVNKKITFIHSFYCWVYLSIFI